VTTPKPAEGAKPIVLLDQLDTLLMAPLYYTPVGERRSFDAAYQVIRAALADAIAVGQEGPSEPEGGG